MGRNAWDEGGTGSTAGRSIRCPSLFFLSRTSGEEALGCLCQLDSPVHFPMLSWGLQVSIPSVALEALLRGPLAFCLHPCIIPHIT